MAATRDPKAEPSAESGTPKDFSHTSINTHVAQTGYNLDKPPIQVEDHKRPNSPVAEFFGSIRALLHRDLAFDALSIVLIALIVAVAFWLGSHMVRFLNEYGKQHIKEMSKPSEVWKQEPSK